MSGSINRIPTPYPLLEYDNQEEFYPNIVKNIYLSERGEDDEIRFGHSKLLTMEDLLDKGEDPSNPRFISRTPEGLLTHPLLAKPVRMLMHKLVNDVFDMCEHIAHRVRQTVKWNLIREYFDNPAKYPHG
jgi:hypothetical protein